MDSFVIFYPRLGPRIVGVILIKAGVFGDNESKKGICEGPPVICV